MPAPAWLSLLSPLPDDATPQRKLVASPDMVANGTDGPIAGWYSLIVYLSEPEYGLRHVHLTLDAGGTLLAGGDHVMFVRETTPDGMEATLTEHHSVGGRFESDGSFRGTHWVSILETKPGEDAGETRSAEHRPPTDEEIAVLRVIAAEVMRRAAS
jgi:hypothetical protein